MDIMHRVIEINFCTLFGVFLNLENENNCGKHIPKTK